MFKCFFIPFSRPHSVLIEALAKDGAATRYLACDSRSISQRIVAGLIGSPPALYRVNALDGDQEVRTVLKVEYSGGVGWGRYTLKNPAGKVMATNPSPIRWLYWCHLTAKEKDVQGRGRKPAYLFFDDAGDSIVEAVRLKRYRWFNKLRNWTCSCKEGPPTTIVKGTFKFKKKTVPALLMSTAPANAFCDFVFPFMEALELGPISTVIEVAEAAKEAGEVHESVVNRKKKIKGELDKFRIVGTSKTIYEVKTENMSNLDKASALLYILQWHYGVHRLHR